MASPAPIVDSNHENYPIHSDVSVRRISISQNETLFDKGDDQDDHLRKLSAKPSRENILSQNSLSDTNQEPIGNQNQIIEKTPKKEIPKINLDSQGYQDIKNNDSGEIDLNQILDIETKS